MDKNVFLAFFLSALVIIAYYFVFPPQSPKNEVADKQTETQSQSSQTQTPAKNNTSGKNSSDQSVSDNTPKQAVPENNIEIKEVKVASEKYKLEISNKNGAVTSLTLSDYIKEIETKKPIYEYILDLVTGKKSQQQVPFDPAQKVQMVNPAVSDKYQPLTYTISENESPIYYNAPLFQELNTTKTESITLTGVSDGINIENTATFYPDSYIVDVTVKLTNLSGEPKTIFPKFVVGTGNEAIPSETEPNRKSGLVYFDKSLDEYSTEELKENSISTNSFDWGGVMSRYFINVVKKPGNSWNAVLDTANSNEVNAAGAVPAFKIAENSSVLQDGAVKVDKFKVYMGPKYIPEMDKFDINMVDSLNMNLNFIAQPMLSVLRWFYKISVNWGVAIILLTILVRILIFPLAYKGMSGMQKMSKLTPKVQALKKKYGKDKEKFNKEVMDLYKKNKANPMGGCLPLIIQLPIFFALYSALLPAIELRYQPFVLWLYDLSKIDYTFTLPVLCGATMFFQQKLTPTPATADPVQIKIMRFFPIMMSIFFAFTSSGLVLYWTISGIISIFQQIIFNKINESRNKKLAEEN